MKSSKKVQSFLRSELFFRNPLSLLKLEDKSAVYHSNINHQMKHDTRINAVCFKREYGVNDSCN